MLVNPIPLRILIRKMYYSSLNNMTIKLILIVSLILGVVYFGYSLSRPPTEPVLMEFVRVVYEKDAKAIVTEWVVPNINKTKDLSRIELLISDSDKKATFGVMLNYGDRLDPIPPGNFGVIMNPSSDDRSIKNVSSAAGIPGRWDQDSPHGILLKQSSRGVTGGNLGISVWIAPKNWTSGRYSIKTRVVKRKHKPSPWLKLATFVYSGNDVKEVTVSKVLVKPMFIDIGYQKPMALDQVREVTLIRYDRQKQDEGVIMKRWAGDTSGEYKNVEKDKRKLNLDDFPGGLIPLEPGIYQFKHNSVRGSSGMTSGYYGSSNFFEIKVEDEIFEVQVLLYPAI